VPNRLKTVLTSFKIGGWVLDLPVSSSQLSGVTTADFQVGNGAQKLMTGSPGQKTAKHRKNR